MNLSHEDEEGHRKEREGRDRRKDPRHDADETRYAAQEDVGSDHVDDEKGKGDGYPGEQQEDHAAEKQADNRVPFHGLPPPLSRRAFSHAIRRNWMVRRRLPTGMMKKTVHLGTVTPSHRSRPASMHSNL